MKFKSTCGCRGTIDNPKGPSIGSLRDTAKEYPEEHGLCPMAPLDQHGEDGKVMIIVTFRAKVELKHGDPLFQLRVKECREREAADRTQEERESLMGPPYIKYKQKAADIS